MLDADRNRPEQFARIGIHTHPGKSAEPSSTDEKIFARCFGNSDWSIMAIVAIGGATYARLQFNVGPAASISIPIEVDFSSAFLGSDYEAWRQEYLAFVHSIEGDWWHSRTASLFGEHLLRWAGVRESICSPLAFPPCERLGMDDIDVFRIPGFREPVNCFTHLVAACVFSVLGYYLVRRGRGG